MKLTAAAVVALLHQSSAFAPTPFTRSTHNARTKTFTRPAIVDPSILSDVHQHVDTLSNFFSSIVVADGDLTDSINTIADAASSAVSAATDAVSTAAVEAVPAAPAAVEAAVTSAAPAAADAAATAASTDGGWFGFLAGPIEFLLMGIHSVLTSVGLSENSWGVSIIAMTTFIKIVTYPLTAQQLESTSKMQVRLFYFMQLFLFVFVFCVPSFPFSSNRNLFHLCNTTTKINIKKGTSTSY